MEQNKDWNQEAFDAMINGGMKEDYWRVKDKWIDIKPRMKLNLYTYASEEEYKKMRQEVREIMELNMVLYGKW